MVLIDGLSLNGMMIGCPPIAVQEGGILIITGDGKVILFPPGATILQVPSIDQP